MDLSILLYPNLSAFHLKDVAPGCFETLSRHLFLYPRAGPRGMWSLKRDVLSRGRPFVFTFSNTFYIITEA